MVSEEELKKALSLMQDHWEKQNNDDDKRSRFIYKAATVAECEKQAKENDVDLNYVLHRWYNYHTSITCEHIFHKYGAVPNPDIYDKEIDLFIKGIPYDVKVSVYPAKLNHAYDISKRCGKDAVIRWMYENQSQQGRKHLANRLFVVCDGGSVRANLELRMDFAQMEQKIKGFMDYYSTRPLYELEINDKSLSEPITVHSDIICLTK